MTVNAIRLQNFMGFRDTGWVELRSINLLFGRNSTGKSAILRALLLLRQSLDSRPEDGPLTFVAEDGQDFGGYRQMVRGQSTERKMSFWFCCEFAQTILPDPKQTANITEYSGDQIGNILLQEFGVEGKTDDERQRAKVELRCRLIYRWDKRQKMVKLHGIDVYDPNRNLILGAQEPKEASEGIWSFWSDFFDPSSTDPDYVAWKSAILHIDAGFLPRLWVLQPENSQDSIGDMNDRDQGWGSKFVGCRKILRGLCNDIATFLYAIQYLGPLRAEPLRYYYVAGQPGNRLDAQGRHVVQTYLAGQRNQANQDRLDQINHWLEYAGVGKRLVFNSVNHQKTLYEIKLVEIPDAQNLQPNLREVGFGVSQVVPVLIQAMLAPAGSMVLIEQPELHLHPAAQAELGDLFLQAAALNNVRFIVETHSEHLLLRLRRRIAESTAEWITPESPLFATPELVGIYHVQRENGKSEMERVLVSGLGKIISPSAFKGFFSNDLEEIEMLAEASLAHSDKG